MRFLVLGLVLLATVTDTAADALADSMLLWPMSAHGVGGALEAKQEAKPTRRRSVMRTLAGGALMGMGFVQLILAANTDCLSDDEIQVELYSQRSYPSRCITSVTKTEDLLGPLGVYKVEYSTKPQIMALWGGGYFVGGLLLATVFADVPVKVDARPDGIYLSKSFW